MYHVLVVDDEPRHRRGIVQLLRQIRPDYRIGEADNGQDALEIVRSGPYRIVITDIRMPIMDGFEFLEQMGRVREPLEIVIITAYRDFEYARKAIRYHACDYLLKPVEVESFHAVIEKAEARLAEELAVQAQALRLTSRLDFTQPIAVERVLNKAIQGRLAPGTWEQFCRSFGLDGPGLAVYAAFRRRAPEAVGTEGNTPEDVLRQRVRQALSPFGSVLDFRDAAQGGDAAAFLVYGERLPVSAAGGWIAQALSGLIGQDRGLDVAFGVGSRCDRMDRHWLDSYRSARSACDRSFFQGFGNVYTEQDGFVEPDAAVLRELDRLTDETAAKLERALRDGAGEEAERLFRLFCRIVERKLPLPPDRIRQAFERLVDGASRWVRQHGPAAAGSAPNGEPVQGTWDDCRTYGETVERAASRLADVRQLAERARAGKAEAIMALCQAYIREHFAEDLSLESVAGHFHFNPSYFSSQFKQFAGIGFSDYLLRVRLQEARRLLETTDDKIYRIAERSGYKDAKYFNRIFKRELGMTPDRYRLMHRIAAAGAPSGPLDRSEGGEGRKS